ncbi:MAG: hypothetical protein HY681_03375 [Chloroflexi bacterium]|nr:hypothetical protein [Chloroflexota bacterium]
MNNQQQREQQFSENLDRLLAGQDIGPAAPDPEAQADHAFARTMLALRSEPSPQFRAELWARLSDTMERKATRSPAWYARLWPRQAIRQVAVVTAAVLLVFGVASVLTRSLPAAPDAVPGVILAVSAATDQTAYRRGEPVGIEVTLKNNTDGPFHLDRFPPILSLMRADTNAPVYTFSAGQSDRTLAPDQSVTFRLIWDQRDDKGRAVRGGAYYLELEDLDYNGEALKLELERRVQFEIKETA